MRKYRGSCSWHRHLHGTSGVTPASIKHTGTGPPTPGPPAASHPGPANPRCTVPSGRTQAWLCRAGPGTPHTARARHPRRGSPKPRAGVRHTTGTQLHGPLCQATLEAGPQGAEFQLSLYYIGRLTSSSPGSGLTGVSHLQLVQSKKQSSAHAWGALTQALGHADPPGTAFTLPPPVSTLRFHWDLFQVAGVLTGRRLGFQSVSDTSCAITPHTDLPLIYSYTSSPPRG